MRFISRIYWLNRWVGEDVRIAKFVNPERPSYKAKLAALPEVCCKIHSKIRKSFAYRIPYIIKKYKVQAHRFTESCVGARDGNFYWRDVGTIDAYWEANMEILKLVQTFLVCYYVEILLNISVSIFPRPMNDI